MQQQYKNNLSNFREWDQLKHADEWLLYPENIGKFMSIDETSLSDGELYTIITNKSAHGRKGSIFAMIKGTKSENICKLIKKLPLRIRHLVKEITLDFANNMNLIARTCFPCAKIVNDRFHLHQLVYDAVQEVRIKYRWEALDKENKNIKIHGRGYKPEELPNGDTLKQLLARSRYLLYKSPDKWKPSQKDRAKLLFDRYPDIKKAYHFAMELGQVFKAEAKEIAYTKLAVWYDKIEKNDLDSFRTIANTIYSHYETILNYFDNKSTNAAAENFNAKIKAFRASFRGVTDIKFFLFRLAKIYA